MIILIRILIARLINEDSLEFKTLFSLKLEVWWYFQKEQLNITAGHNFLH